MRWVKRMIAVLLPWTPRAERKSRVEAARQGAEQATRKAAEAHSLTDEIRRLRAHNHVYEALDLMVARKAREQRHQ